MSVVYELVRSRVRPGAEEDIPEAAAMAELLHEIVSFERGVDREPLEAR